MLWSIFAVVLAIAVGTAHAQDQSMCNVSGANIVSLPNATYNGFLAGSRGYVPVVVKTAWCGSINDTVCNVTNYAAVIVTPGPEDQSLCIASFATFYGPMSFNATAGLATMTLWGPLGYTANIAVQCNASGMLNEASLVGPLVEYPRDTFSMSFNSKAACP